MIYNNPKFSNVLYKSSSFIKLFQISKKIIFDNMLSKFE